MIKGLSFLIACALTVLLVAILYPIAAIFWILGQIGYFVGMVSEWIFSHANTIIRRLWAELRNTQELPDDDADYRM